LGFRSGYFKTVLRIQVVAIQFPGDLTWLHKNEYGKFLRDVSRHAGLGLARMR
jgi:hypothetical protein